MMNSRRKCLHLSIFCASYLSTAAFRPTESKFKSLSRHMSLILESPSAERNKTPIWESVIQPLIPQLLHQNPPTFKVLELAAGTGVHTVYFASSFLSPYPNVQLEWYPSDPDREARSSIDARVQQSNLQCILPANGWILGREGGTACNDGIRDRNGDAGADREVGVGHSSCYRHFHDTFDLVLCINMMHIAPWTATMGLMECAGKVLKRGGMLMCYGPFKVGGTAVESNLNFDASLRSKDPAWGIRDLENVVEVAKENGLEFVQSVDMPANNLSIVFSRT